MNEFDCYCITLLDEAKRFLEIASEKYKIDQNNNVVPYLRASLLISFSSLEAIVFGVSDDFVDSTALSLHEKAFLDEKEIILKNGDFEISDRLKMTRLTDRIEFLMQKFKPNSLNKNDAWWPQLNEGIRKRNSIVHPRENEKLTIENVRIYIYAIIQCIDAIYRAVYGRGFPQRSLGLTAKNNFD